MSLILPLLTFNIQNLMNYDLWYYISDPPKLFKLKVDENTGLNVTVSWEKPKCNIQSYQIRCVDEDGELSTGETDSSIPQYTKRNLIPGCRYDIEVAAVNDSGIGPYSEILTFNAGEVN